jgi:hypothetical protein
VGRTLLPVLAALALTGCGSSTQGSAESLTTGTAQPSSAVTEQSVCPSEQSAGITAVFGRRKTPAAAQQLAASAQAVGFEGLAVERRGCDDYAVVLHGLRDLRQAKDFGAETESVGFHVQIECRSHPVEGGLAAVFGHRRTRRAALRLRAEAEHVGFPGLRVQQDHCHDWEVDLYGLKTAAQRHEFAREARRVGFHIVYELG